jgi:hypothetical protein
VKLGRTRPFTSARLYRWVKPEKNPMNSTIDPEAPELNDPEDEEEGDEGDEGDGEESSDTLVEEWETENGIVFELHSVEDHDEVLVVETYEDELPPPRAKGEENDQIVGVALSIDDLEECMDIMKQIHKKMVERQLTRSPKMKPVPKAAARK